MLSTHLRSAKILLVLAAFAALLLGDADALRADKPQMVELTIMFRRPLSVPDLDPFPMPDGEDAIGIVLDGWASQSVGPVWCNYGFGDFSGVYFWTDGLYITKGGAVWYTTVFVRYEGYLPVVPAHGFISFRDSCITDVGAYTASHDGGVWYPDPHGGTEMVFAHGLFRLY